MRVRPLLLASLTAVAMAGLIWAVWTDDDVAQEESSLEPRGSRDSREPRRRRSPHREGGLAPSLLPEITSEEDLGLAGLPAGRRSLGDESPTSPERGTIRLGDPNAAIVIAPPPDRPRPAEDPDALALRRARQIERLFVSQRRANAELDRAEASGDVDEIARLSELVRQISVRQAALETAATESR